MVFAYLDDRVDRAIGVRRDVEQQVAVLGDNVDLQPGQAWRVTCSRSVQSVAVGGFAARRIRSAALLAVLVRAL